MLATIYEDKWSAFDHNLRRMSSFICSFLHETEFAFILGMHTCVSLLKYDCNEKLESRVQQNASVGKLTAQHQP